MKFQTFGIRDYLEMRKYKIHVDPRLALLDLDEPGAQRYQSN